jgi:phospholipid/cholesterol/gamma-HCH transport system ATP-binding protein
MTDGADPVIELRGVHKAFGANQVLRGVDLAIRPGETFTILGGSGSGKSVCLKHMIGLLRPDRGRVFAFGQDITKMPERALVDVRKHASMIFQSGALFDSLPVFENIAYPLREHRRLDEGQLAQRVGDCLEAVGLEGVEQRMPAELSGGMRKRVAVARGIALEPAVILYDEPTTGLDPANQRRIGDLIQSLQRRLGITSVIVTHELELCFAISDRVALLKRGRIAVMGTAESIRNSDDRDVIAFLDGAQEHDPEAPLGAQEVRPDGP